MESFLINPFSVIEKNRICCVTKIKHTFEDNNGKLTKGIYDILESNSYDHVGYPYNDKKIVGGFIVNGEFDTYPLQSYFGFKSGFDENGNDIYCFLGGKSLFYTESNHSEQEIYDFLKDIIYFPKDEIENILIGDTMVRYTHMMTFNSNSYFPIPYYPKYSY